MEMDADVRVSVVMCLNATLSAGLVPVKLVLPAPLVMIVVLLDSLVSDVHQRASASWPGQGRVTTSLDYAIVMICGQDFSAILKVRTSYNSFMIYHLSLSLS